MTDMSTLTNTPHTITVIVVQERNRYGALLIKEINDSVQFV